MFQMSWGEGVESSALLRPTRTKNHSAVRLDDALFFVSIRDNKDAGSFLM